MRAERAYVDGLVGGGGGVHVLDGEAVRADHQLRLAHVGVVQQVQVRHLLLPDAAVLVHAEHLWPRVQHSLGSERRS
jgi:hypothetical protein